MSQPAKKVSASRIKARLRIPPSPPSLWITQPKNSINRARLVRPTSIKVVNMLISSPTSAKEHEPDEDKEYGNSSKEVNKSSLHSSFSTSNFKFLFSHKIPPNLLSEMWLLDSLREHA